MALPESGFSKPETLNVLDFQSYLDNVLERSIDRDAKSGGERGTREEIVLPFRFTNPVSPDDSADSEGTQSDEAA